MIKGKVKFAALFSLVVFTLCVFFAISCLFLSSCSDDPFNNERSHERNALDKKTERLLKQDYWQYLFSDRQRSVLSVDDVRIDYYLGTYNGCVLFVNLGSIGNGGFTIDGYRRISIHGYDFIFPTYFDMYAWKKGAVAYKESSFYDLYYKDSLESVSLTKNDAKDMYKRYLAYKVTINYEDFYPGAFEGLNEETKRQIKLDWWQDIYNDWWRGIYTFNDHSIVKDVWIDYYLGTYNGYVIIASLRTTRWTSRIVINGYDFLFPTNFLMYAWRQNEDSEKGTFYRILNDNDFKNLSLTNEDADRMYERYLTLNILNDKRLSYKAYDGLDADIAWNIKHDFRKAQPPGYQASSLDDEISIMYYLGTYNDYVIYFNQGGLGMSDLFGIHDFTFFTGSRIHNVFAWKQNSNSGSGQIFVHYRQQEPFEKINFEDILSYDDVMEMKKRYERGE